MERRPEIDRWIISVLNTLIQDVDRNLADYEPTRAARAIADLLERIFRTGTYASIESVFGVVA